MSDDLSIKKIDTSTQRATSGQNKDSAKILSGVFGFGFNDIASKGVSLEKTSVESVDKVQEVEFENNNNKSNAAIYQALPVGTREEHAQDISLDLIQGSIKQAQEIYDNLNYGDADKAYDELKELFCSQRTTYKLKQKIKDEQYSCDFLKKAQMGQLTQKDYYQENKERLKGMIKDHIFEYYSTGREDLDKYLDLNFKPKDDNNNYEDGPQNVDIKAIQPLANDQIKPQLRVLEEIDKDYSDFLINLTSEETQRKIENYIDYMIDNADDINAIKRMQVKLLQMDEKSSIEFAQEFVNNALNHTDKIDDRIKINENDSTASMGNGPEKEDFSTSTKLMSFNDVYNYECGHPFDIKEVEDFLVAENKIAIINEKAEQLQSMNQILSDLELYVDTTEVNEEELAEAQDRFNRLKTRTTTNILNYDDESRIRGFSYLQDIEDYNKNKTFVRPNANDITRFDGTSGFLAEQSNLNRREDELIELSAKQKKYLPKQMDDFSKLLTEYYTLNPKLAEKELGAIISENKLPVNLEVDKTGAIKIGVDDVMDVDCGKAVLTLMREFNKKQQDKFNNMVESLGGLDEIKEDYENSYNKIQGNYRAEEAAKILKDDNVKNAISNVCGGAETAGTIMIVLGTVLSFTPAARVGVPMAATGVKLIIGSKVVEGAILLTNAVTREDVDFSEVRGIVKDQIVNLTTRRVSKYAGIVSSKVFTRISGGVINELEGKNVGEIIKTVFKNPKAIGTLAVGGTAKLVTNYTIKSTGDIAMMELLDNDDNLEDILKNNVLNSL